MISLVSRSTVGDAMLLPFLALYMTIHVISFFIFVHGEKINRRTKTDLI